MVLRASLVCAAGALLTGCFAGLGREPIASEALSSASAEDLPRLPAPEVTPPAEAPGAPRQETDRHDHDEHVDGPGADDATRLPGGPAPALRYAAMDKATCEAELTRRGASFEKVDSARGVVAPIRLRGPLSGVVYRSVLPPAQRRTTPYEILDCRLALALDDLAKILAKHDVVEVAHMSMYRPPPGKGLMEKPGRRHGGALAIDVGTLILKDGKTLVVERDFRGGIGQKPCGPKAPANPTPLRALYCEAADAGIFNVMLSPDYNWAHRNHFHLEVTANVRWTLVR